MKPPTKFMYKSHLLKLSGLLIVLGLALPAFAQDQEGGQGLMVVETRDPGEYIADSAGVTLYTLADPNVAGGQDVGVTIPAEGSMTGGAEEGTMTGGGETGGAMTGGAEMGMGAGVLPCEGECAEAWPPFTVDSEDAVQSIEVTGGTEDVSSLLGTTEREDGSYQVTYNGYPLYYFSQDQQPGDQAGLGLEGFGGVWYMVSVEGNVLSGEGSITGGNE